MNGESIMEAYTLTYVNKQPRRVCCVTRGLKLKLWNNPEGWERAGGGRETQEGGDIRTPTVNSC